jgi:glutathione reductase (NADPH)
MAKKYDLIVIGTGVAATKIAQSCRTAGWRVAIVDRRPYGGTCMLRGCDPKKLLWGVAAAVEQARRFTKAGFTPKDIVLDWPELIRFAALWRARSTRPTNSGAGKLRGNSGR